MKKLLTIASTLALTLTLTFAGVAEAKAGAAISAHDGPFIFGQSYGTFDVVDTFTPVNGGRNGRSGPAQGYWTRIDCYVSGSVVYARFADLTPNANGQFTQSGFTFGPTPSWPAPGSSADCQLQLLGLDNGAFTLYALSEFFPAIP